MAGDGIRKIRKSNSDSNLPRAASYREYIDSSGGANFTRKVLGKYASDDSLPKINDGGAKSTSSPYSDFLPQQSKRAEKAKIDLPADSDPKSLTEQELRQWSKTKEQFDLWLNVRVKDQPQTSDNSHLERLKEQFDLWLNVKAKDRPQTSDNSHLEQRSRWSERLSDLNESFEMLNADSVYLHPMVQINFSESLEKRCAKAKKAFASLIILEAASDLAERNLTKASDNQLAQKLTIATKEFNKELGRLESLEREAMGRILDHRFKRIDATYRKLINDLKEHNEQMIDGLEALERMDARDREESYEPSSRIQDLKRSYEERAHELSQTYQDLSSQFGLLRDREKVQTRSTYKDCQLHLNKMDDSLYMIVLEGYPLVQKAASDLMQPIIDEANSVDTILSQHGRPENPYNSEARQDRFKQVERITVQGLLTTPGIATSSVESYEISQDLKQLASEVRQARKCCEKVTKVEEQVNTSLAFIEFVLKENGIPTDRFGQKWRNQFQEQLRYALSEGAQGRNGREFEKLKKMALPILRAKEVRDTVDMMSQLSYEKGLTTLQGHRDTLLREHSDVLVEAVQGRDERPAFKLLEQKLKEEMLKRFDSYQDKIVKMEATFRQLITNTQEIFPIIVRNDHQSFTSGEEQLNLLKEFSDQFKQLRENAKEKSDSERTKDNRILMKTLSQIEELTQNLEQHIEDQIDRRFSASQDKIRNHRPLHNIKPDKLLVKKHIEACSRFEEARVKIRATSGDTRTQGNTSLGNILFGIESLEGKIEAKIHQQHKIEAKIHQQLKQMKERREQMLPLRELQDWMGMGNRQERQQLGWMWMRQMRNWMIDWMIDA